VRRQLVLAIGREDVPNHRSAARSGRQTIDVAALRHLEADRVVGRPRAHGGITDRQRADAPRGGDVALEQQRRRPQRIGDVVEAEVAAIARQQIRDIDLEPEEIANRIAVFRAIETMEDELAGLNTGAPRAIE
jgi:hypothetical protein